MTEKKLCQCGCGSQVSKPSNKFIRGHNRKNCKLSEDHIHIIKKYNKGKIRSFKTKQKISSKIKELYKSEESPYTETTIRKRKESLTLAWKNLDSKWFTSECKEKQKNANLNNRKNGLYSSNEYKDKLSVAHKKLWDDPNSSYNSIERKEKISKSIKALYKNPDFLNKLQLGLKTKPNRVEKKLFSVLCNITNSFKFVGDLSLWIGGKNPDFIDIKNKKIIELFGDYWHSESVTGMKETDHIKERTIHFEQYGYSCLIIWESELKCIEQTENKIRIFIKENCYE